MTAEEIKEAENIRNHVNNMINETFKILAEIYKNQEGETDIHASKGCRLIFPHYSPKDDKEQTRISEQELRFTFAYVFNQYCNCKYSEMDSKERGYPQKELPWFYSIEAPTMKKYRFSENKKHIYPKIDNTGQSANFDFVIHNESTKRICLIEFKALNPDWHAHHKDFIKLIEDPTEPTPTQYCPYTQRYFIEVLENSNPKTYTNLADKKIHLKDDKLKEFREKAPNINIITYNDTQQDSLLNSHIRFCCFSLNVKNGTISDITDKIIKP